MEEYGDYIALSYALGTKPRSRTIRLNGKTFLVTTNVESALLQIRLLLRQKHIDISCANSGFIVSTSDGTDRRTVRLWIDAICINQDDSDERVKQIMLMDRVYTNATGLLVWLGPEADNSNAAMELLNTLDIWDEDSLRNGLQNCSK
jgi:hypothetical protein